MSTALSMKFLSSFFHTLSIISIVIRTASSQTSLLFGYHWCVRVMRNKEIDGISEGTSEKAGFAIFRCFFHSSPGVVLCQKLNGEHSILTLPSVATIFLPNCNTKPYCSMGFTHLALYDVISCTIRFSLKSGRRKQLHSQP